MAEPLSKLDKRKTNPFPKEMFGKDPVSGLTYNRGYVPTTINYTTGGRNGNYDYGDPRKKFVINTIHWVFRNRGRFMQVGEYVTLPPRLQEDPDNPGSTDLQIPIEAADVLAYVALYPQNGIVKKARTGLTRRYRTRNRDQLKIVPLTPDEAHAELVNLQEFIDTQRKPGTSGGTTVTTPAAQQPQNQGDIEGDDGNPTLQEEEDGKVARMAALPENPEGKTPSPLDRKEETPEDSAASAAVFDITKIQLEFDGPGSLFKETATHWIYVVQTSFTIAEANYETQEGYRGLNDRSPSNEAIHFGAFEIVEHIGAWDHIMAFCGDGVTRMAALTECLTLMPLIKFQPYLNPNHGPAARWITAVHILKDDLGVATKSEDTKDSSDKSEPEKQKEALDDPSLYQAAFELENLPAKAKKAAKVLRDYAQILKKEGISFKSKLNLTHEATLLEQLPDDIDKLLAINGKLYLAGPGGIQFNFKGSRKDGMTINTFYWLGVGPYYKGLGKAGDDSPNAFKKYSQQTYGFVFMLNKIADETGSKPWTAFLQEYVFPYADYSAARLLEEKEQDTLALSKIKDKDKLFKTKKEVERGVPTIEKLNQMGINSTTLYNQINMISLDCNTLQSQAMRNFLKLYKATISKTRWEDLTKLALVTLRNEIIKDQAAKMLLTDAARYSNNLNLLEADAEREVNRSLYCILDAIGDNFERKILSPMGLPPKGKDLFRNSLNPPKGIRFSGPSTVDFYRAWRNKVRKLLVNYMGQLMMGVLTDVLKAALACGPDPGKTEKELKNPKRNQNYGALQINVHAGDVDFLQVASAVPLLNKSVTRDENGEVIIETSPPTIEQIRQLNSDVSNILLPDQVLSLLDGDSSEELIDIIRNMINEGPADYLDLTLREITDLDPIERLLRQESLRPGDPRYAVLGPAETGFTNESIIRYFLALGDAIDPDRRLALGEDILNQTPDEAFCANNKSFEPPERAVFPDMSEEQIISQIDQRMYVNTQQALSMCDMIKGFLDFQIKMDSYKNSLGPPEWYTEFLKSLERTSRSLMKSSGASMAAKAIETPQAAPGVDIKNTILGKALISTYPQIEESKLFPRITSMGGVPAYYIPFGTEEMGQLWLTYDNDTATVEYLQPRAYSETLRLQLRLENLISQLRAWWNPEHRYGSGPSENYITNMIFRRIMPESRPNDPNDIVIPPDVQRRNSPPDPLVNIGRGNWSEVYQHADHTHTLARTFPPQPAHIPTLNNYLVIARDHRGDSPFSHTFGPLDEVTLSLDYLARITNMIPQTGPGTRSDSREYTSDNMYPSIEGYIERLRLQLQDFSYYPTWVEEEMPENWLAEMEDKIRHLEGVRDGIHEIVNELQARGDERIAVASTKLAARNVSGNTPLTLRNKRNPDGSPVDQRLIALTNDNVQTLLNQQLEWRTRLNFRKIVSNDSQDFLTQIAAVYTMEIGQRRLPKAFEAINSSPFEASDRLCLSEEDQTKANAALGAIQSRVNGFFTNTLPLFRVYLGWNTPDTLNLLSNYLMHKIQTELNAIGLYGALVEALPLVQKLYAPGPRNEGKSIEFNSRQTADDRIQAIIFKFLQNTLKQLELSDSDYKEVNLSSLGSMSLRNQYYSLALGFRQALKAAGRRGSAAIPLEFSQVQETYLAPNDPNAWELIDEFLYYFPVPLLIGFQIIFYDSNLSLTKVTPNFWEADVRAREASNTALIKAFNPEYISENILSLEAFPLVIKDFRGEDRTFYNPEGIMRRIDTELFREYQTITDQYNADSQELAQAITTIVDLNNSMLSDGPLSWEEAEEIIARTSGPGRGDHISNRIPWRLTNPGRVLEELDAYPDDDSFPHPQTGASAALRSRTIFYKTLDYFARTRQIMYLTDAERELVIESGDADPWGLMSYRLLAEGIANPRLNILRTRTKEAQTLLNKIKKEITTLEEFLKLNSPNFVRSTSVADIEALRPFPFEGVTSMDEDHYHQYTVDFDGNGAALEVVHPGEPRISHHHEILRWQIQPAASHCYQADAANPNSCESLYNQAGVGPHVHYFLTDPFRIAGDLLDRVVIDRVGMDNLPPLLPLI